MHWNQFHLFIPCSAAIAGVLLAFYGGNTNQVDLVSFMVFAAVLFAGFYFTAALRALLKLQSVRILLVSTFFLVLSFLRLEWKEASHLNTNSFVNEIHTFKGEVTDAKEVRKGYKLIQVQLKGLVQGETICPRDEKVLLISGPALNTPSVGDVCVFSATLEDFHSDPNPGSFDAKWYYETHGITATGFVPESNFLKVGHRSSVTDFFLRSRTRLSKLIQTYLPADLSGVAMALVLGDKSQLSPETIQVFSVTGAMHLLAVSGMHVGILIVIFQRFFSLFPRRISKQQALVLALICAAGYTLLTGASPSIVRSFIMFTFLSLGSLLNRRSSTLNALFLSAIVLVIYDPLVIFDIGFQLSYMAVLGILVLNPYVEQLFQFRFKALQWLWNGSAVGISATLFTFPLTLFWFHQFPNYFLASNVVVMVLGGVLLLLGVLFVAFAWWNPLAIVLAFVFSIGLIFLVRSLDWMAKLPGGTSMGFQLEWWLVLALYAVLVVLVFHRSKIYRFGALTAFTLLIAICSIYRWNELDRKELTIANNETFVCFLSVDNSNIVVFDPELEAIKLDRLVSQTEKYTGKVFQRIPLEKSLSLKINHSEFHFRKEKKGYNFSNNGKTYFYQTSGFPAENSNPRLLSKKLQKVVRPNEQFQPFTIRFE